MDGPTYTARCEGRKNVAYQDQNGVWTVGIGFTGPMLTMPGVTVGPGLILTDAEIDAEFAARYPTYAAEAAADLGPSWSSLDEVRQAALTDDAYQDGGGNPRTGSGGLAGYHRMLAAVRIEDWDTAAAECIASRDEVLTKARTERRAGMLRTGEWPAEPW